jgi:hypothetical protein
LFNNIIFEEREIIKSFAKPVVVAKTKPFAKNQTRNYPTTPRFNTMQKRPIDYERTCKEQFKIFEENRAKQRLLQAKMTKVSKPVSQK